MAAALISDHDPRSQKTEIVTKIIEPVLPRPVKYIYINKTAGFGFMYSSHTMKKITEVTVCLSHDTRCFGDQRVWGSQ